MRERRWLAIVGTAAALVVLGGCWPQFRGSSDRIGRQDAETAMGPSAAARLRPMWSLSTGGSVDSSPAVSSGVVYVGSSDQKLYAVDAKTGASVWSAATGGAVTSSPAVSSNNVVYVGSADGVLRAFDSATGALRWSAATKAAIESSPVLVGSSVVVGSDDGTVDAFDATTGVLIWSTATGGAVRSSPAAKGTTLYVGSDDAKLYALDVATGHEIWTASTGGAVRSTPAVSGGAVYVGSDDHTLRSYDAVTGTQHWKVTFGGAVDSSPAVDGAGIVYSGGEDGVLRAVNPTTGTTRWSVALGSGAYSSPVIADGVLYIGTRAGRLLAYTTSNGALVSSNTTGGAILSSPAEDSQAVYVGSGDGSLYAYEAASPCSGLLNPIVCENSKPGTPRSVWDISGSGDPSIQGFATDISVNVGDTVHFKVNTPATAWHADVYRLGYYGGLGAREVGTFSPPVPLPQSQPNCLADPGTDLVDCGNWAESASWTVPADAVSGIYVAKLIRDDVSGAASHIVFVVRNDASHSDLLFQTSDTTWEAYNTYGNASLYIIGPYNLHAAQKVSYNRPLNNRGVAMYAANQVFGDSEYPMVFFLEANGYDVSYASAVDTDRFGSHLLNHKAFLSVGHDEYWSRSQRDNVEAARDAGVDLGFFSGNESYWKTRWEPSIDASADAYRTLVSYKESSPSDSQQVDPSGVWTGLWRDHRLSPPYDGGRPENAMSGTIFANSPVDCCDSFSLTVSAQQGKLRLWRDTSLATLASGTSVTFGDRVVGYEFDEDLDNGYRPAGLVDLSSDVRPSNRHVHHITFYRAASRALVFAVGTNQWGFGLDNQGGPTGSTPDVRIQQATVNALADMGVLPQTLMGGLVFEGPSTDAIAPTSTITQPAAGTTVQAGTTVTVTGTATDGGGGQVGTVEVSVDGGTSWHPAVGSGQWTFTFTPNVATGPLTILSRAADDSGNIEAVPAARSVTVTPRTCPCTIFGANVPTVADSGVAGPIEVGLKFRADVAGQVTALRFYKSAANTGTHVASLWTANGTLLGQATFSAETASGWQQASLPAPVSLTAGALYIVSYHTDSGHVADDKWFSTHSGDFYDITGVDATPLHMVSGAGPDAPNGVFSTGATAFPTTPSSAENYWVDVVFAQ